MYLCGFFNKRALVLYRHKHTEIFTGEVIWGWPKIRSGFSIRCVQKSERTFWPIPYDAEPGLGSGPQVMQRQGQHLRQSAHQCCTLDTSLASP